ncbi:MAG: 5'-methylthioadenosine/S-adenosylhomocysteine nucleosidase [Lachnospiraceae bacterium]|nr:5'-methylthioadenosine/S-adenosylhomocysteine nucleosidase [Lachnospiraceae bacterium]
MKIGMIVAIPEEIGALLKRCGEPMDSFKVEGYDIFCYKIGEHELFVAGSGAGEIAAAATTQFLITAFKVEKIINFGVVGGLTDEMTLSNVVVVEKCVHYDFDASPFVEGTVPGQYAQFPDIYIPADKELIKEAIEAVPSLKPVICASADKFVADPKMKRILHEKYDADICEMESAGILLTCIRNKVPALCIKAVSDSVEGGEQEFAKMVHEASKACVRVLLKILGK